MGDLVVELLLLSSEFSELFSEISSLLFSGESTVGLLLVTLVKLGDTVTEDTGPLLLFRSAAVSSTLSKVSSCV